MKKTSIIFVLLISFVCVASHAQDKRLSAFFTHSSFFYPGETPYVETYILFDAWSLNFVKNKDNKYQSTLEITLSASIRDTIFYARKYQLKSPEISDPAQNNFQFLDLQRFSLPNGTYTLKLSVQDINSKYPQEDIVDTIFVTYPQINASISSILIAKDSSTTTSENILTRTAGYDIHPYPNSFIPASISKLNYYFEVYNIQNEITTDKQFATHCYIETLETGQKILNTEQYTRYPVDTIIPHYGVIDISSLSSGNYNLVVEIINMKNDLILFRKYPFQRSNPGVEDNVESRANPLNNFALNITNDTIITYYVKSLWPIANSDERSFISKCKKATTEEKQHFLYYFWLKRDELNAETEWLKYKKEVDYVESNFAYGKTPGFMTDRGRVYLQYGAPNYIIDERHKVSIRNHETQGQVFYYPYQMWRYDELPNNEPRRMFVFFDEFLAGDFKLLHSNAFGEVQDMFWERRLSRNILDEYVQGEAGMQFERGY